MSSLAELKKQLHSKPVVHNREPIFIHLEEPKEKEKEKEKETNKSNQADITVKIQDKRSEGFNPDKFLNRIKQTKLSTVIPKKDINGPEPVVIESKAPEIIEEIQPPKVKKIKSKIGKEFVIMDDNEKEPEKREENIEKTETVAMTEEPGNVVEPPIKKKKSKPILALDKPSKIQLGDTSLKKRLPENPPNINIKVSSYFMNNREIFVNFINGLFEPYRKIISNKTQNITCENIGQTSGELGLLTHQQIVRDYINLYTPYRGLLLYHGLGSGKTCSSIAIAEGFKSTNRIIVMTPASLRRNYLEEIKKCGDLLFRKNQYWEWVHAEDDPNITHTLSSALGLSTEFIRRKKGAWLVNVTKPSNYDTLSSSDRKKIDEQIDEMIQNKYTFINYNGLRKEKFNNMTQNGTINIFDEAHNLVSRIVNKINRSKAFSRGPKHALPESLSLKIYELLLRATNCRVVLLTGTPIINYPNEIGILFNILRGYIKSWNFTLNVETSNKINVETLSAMFLKNKVMDYIGYSPNTKILTITRNPYGFENKITGSSGYKGVTNEKKEKVNEKGELVLDERGVLSDEDFIKRVTGTLKDNGITAVPQGTTFDVNTALPDSLEGFMNLFIDVRTGEVENMEKFKKRIIGLTSFFRSAQEELLPEYEKTTDLHVLKIPMSDYQFKVYEEARIEERINEKRNKKSTKPKVDKNGIFIEPTSTYRIFSRLFCNFVMPKPPGRPKPPPKMLGPIDLHKETEEEGEEKEEEARALPVEEKKKRGPKKGTRKAEIIREVQEVVEVAPVGTPKTKKTTTRKKTGGANSDDDDDEVEGEREVTEKAETAAEDDEENVAVPEYQNEDANMRTREELEGDELLDVEGGQLYREQIKESIRFLKAHGEEYLSPEGLSIYSPKFLAMLQNIQNPNHLGLNLIYSQFRSMEGIAIFCLVLEQNGFAQFKIKKIGVDGWALDMSEEDVGKPTFALYTGTEEAEEREIIRNIYNGDWHHVPTGLATQLKKISNNNLMGEIIKILMITAAGSEGINLKNTRYVHLMEPYWHPVRLEQVIGRARRICSHTKLPKALQTVEVFLYLMTFTEKQLASDEAIELKTQDIGKKNFKIPLSSDEALYEISSIKEEITAQLLKAIKEASIDCAIHSQLSTAKSRQGKSKEQLEKEQLHCLNFGNPSINEFAYNPSYTQDENDTVANLNKSTTQWTGTEIKIPVEENGRMVKKQFIIRNGTEDLYDYDTYQQALAVPGFMPILVGKIQKQQNGKYIFIPI